MEILQLAVAELEAPLEPWSWLWPFLDCLALCCKGQSHNGAWSCNLQLQKLHWSLAAGFGHISGRSGFLLHTFYSLLVCQWISAGQSHIGDPTTWSCRSSIWALPVQLALAIFLGSPALCIIHSIACWSGYLLASKQLENEDSATCCCRSSISAEAPLEPCQCWLQSWGWGPGLKNPHCGLLLFKYFPPFKEKQSRRLICHFCSEV